MNRIAAYDFNAENDFNRQLLVENRVNKMMEDKGYVIQVLSEISDSSHLADYALNLFIDPSVQNHMRFAALFSALAGEYFTNLAEKELEQ